MFGNFKNTREPSPCVPQVVEYTYSAWGELLSTTGIKAETIGATNPIRYRGYYYDTETGFYYLQSRYYDPITLRMLNSDTTGILSANHSLYDKNLFAYCDNNPVVRLDTQGDAWETIFDVISLGTSIAEVVYAPNNVMSWVGLAGDVIDLIPFVTGVGESIRAIKVTTKVAKKADDVADTVNAGRKISNTTTTLTKSTKIHGNSLKTTKPAIGYALRSNDDINRILKYGETTRGIKRYTNKFYTQNNVYMDIMAYGSKHDMHFWQHDKIMEYYNLNHQKPPLNKSFW